MPTGEGYGFGLAKTSYKSFAVNSGSLYLKAKYSFSFSTTSANGILLISLNQKRTKFDYEILYLEGGKIKYTFNLGAGPLTIASASTVNDGKKHSVLTTRKSRNGKLTVDGVVVQGKSPGKLTSMNSIIRLFVGGAPNNFATFQKIPSAVRRSMVGCISNLKVNNKVLKSDEETVGVTGCLPEYSAPGLFFGSGGGYGYLSKNFIGKKVLLKFTVKPRSDTGVIFYIAKNNFDYLTVELHKGEVQVSVQNGAGQFEVIIPPAPGSSFCDGKLHDILVDKANDKVTVTVDSLPSKSASKSGSTSVDAGGNAYIGGIPASIKSFYGVRSRASFNGCIVQYLYRGKDRTADIVPFDLAMRGCK